MAPSTTNNKYHELTEKQKRAVLGALLSMRENGVLPHGSQAKIARNLRVSRFAVGRLWRAAESSRLDPNGVVHSPDVSSKKKGNNSEMKKVYDREQMKEAILAIPLWKRSTVRNLAAVTNVRYCTLIQPTLLPRRGDQISTTAIVSTNPFTKLWMIEL